MKSAELKKYADFGMKALVSQFAPGILKGTIVELFRSKELDVAKTIEWVQANHSLWDRIGLEDRKSLRRLVSDVGNIDWLNAKWAIDALKDDFPAVASLFLSEEEAHNWLEHQLGIIKHQISQQGG